jgi:hypothetical protein
MSRSIINAIVKFKLCFILLSFIACNTSSEETNSSNADENSSSQIESSRKKCSDMDSYDYGYAVARDQDGLLADCNYLYDIAITQKNIENKGCFCSGVTDYRNNK